MFSNLTQSVGVPLNGVIINLGNLLRLNGLLSPVPAVYGSPVILHQFSPATYVVRALLVVFFYKNIFYKNIEAEICEILRIL